ncbi:unnamed protein product [Paramecium sonneborni]|uniref:Uncharacterized protein n=1 Tax=Paramecium sonneborni TaxID=65129 RepID=A0A8S1P4S3_9CILI|nr:unnamed protein product [Paramecium sonneborni]
MLQNTMNSHSKKAQESLLISTSGIVSKQNVIQILIFFILHCLIDLALLIQYPNYLEYIIPKMSMNILMALIILSFQKKLTHVIINIFLLVVKLNSILFLLLIGQDYILIVVLICEHEHNNNSANFISLESSIQNIITKVGCLVIMIIQFQIIDIIIIASILFQETCQLGFLLQKSKKQNIGELFSSFQNKNNRETLTICTKENTWMSRISSLPICFILISKKDLKLTYKNQNVYTHFSTICKNEEEFDKLILNQLDFSIISEFFEDQKNIVTDQHIKKNRLRNNVTSQKSNQDKKDFSDQESINQQQYKETNKLSEIIENYKEGKLWETTNSINNSLELFCQHFWENSKCSTYSGQIIINQEDDEIILTLIDISKQNKYYDEMIKDQFKTSIAQSFSHELRTPLNSSCNFLQCCLNHKSIEEDLKIKFLQPAINALRLQSYLINDIIDFSSLCADNLELDIKDFSIKDLVDEINKLFKSVIEMKNLVLYVDLLENQLNNLCTDFSRLVQIIVNILQNSIKYSNSGYILLKLTSFSSNYLKITIKDEGFGIKEDQLMKIHQMLLDVEQRQNFSQYQSWHGFGLLISSMLLSKLCPADYKSLLIRSGGEGQGTKVTFYIQNHKLSHQSSSVNYKEKPIRFNSKLRQSNVSGSIHHLSLNGTLIQISDLFVSNRKLNTQFVKKVTLKSVKSNENSIFSDSIINLDQDLQISELHHLQPFLFTENAQQKIKFNKQELSPKSNHQQTKIVSYKQLKLQEDQESEQNLKTIMRKKKCNCKRILSVDDEIFNQKSIQFLLSQQGFEVLLAFNGEEAIQLIIQTQKCNHNCSLFLLILMDYQMPIMNGIQATKQLRLMMEQHQIPQIHIIGLTAFNSKNDILMCLNSGMSDVLTKPLIIKDLFEILQLV